MTHDDACINEDAMDHGRLLAFRAGNLAPADADAVERHLIECAYCRAFLHVLTEPEDPERLARLERLDPDRGRRRLRGLLAAGALAAGVLLGIVLLPQRTGTDAGSYVYRLAAIEGGAARSRGTSANDGTRTSSVFLPQGDLKIRLEPTGVVPSRWAVRVFVADPASGGLLEPREASISRGDGGEIGISATAQALLGPRPGKKTLYVAIAESDSALRGLAGQAANAIDRQNVHVVSIELALAP
jgi:hypothetical protein